MTAWSLSLVHRAVGRHDVGDQILDLIDGQEATGAETRHARTRNGGLRIINPLVDRLHVRLAILAGLAVFEQARPEGAEAQLLALQLVAGVAIAAVLLARRVVGETAAV